MQRVIDADPTLEFLDRLNDPSKWVVRRAVPLFKAHARKGHDGEDVKVTVNDLTTIAANTAELERRHGVAGRITPGHLQPDQGEEVQPTLYGFFRNPRVGKFGPGSEPAVLVDCYYFPEYAGLADRLPYRSAEYYPGEKTIRGMALLKSDPFLDLGVVTYTGGGRAYHYATGAGMTIDPKAGQNTDITPAEMALFDKLYKYLCSTGKMKAPPTADSITGVTDGEGLPPLAMSKSEMDDALAYSKEHNVPFAAGRKAVLAKRNPLVTRLRVQVDRLAGEMADLTPVREYQGELSRDQLDAALAYQATNDCDWPEARRAVLSGK